MSKFHIFEDHSDEMFGRKADIGRLIKRSRSKGLTAVVGRPQMGKTWLLEQVGGLLGKEHDCIVGYHESKGESDDHLKRTVLDLYKRWLSSASMEGQLKSLFTRHKGALVTGVGRVFGALFKEFLPAGGGLIDEAFKKLATVDEDLKTAGIELPTLDYDKCLSLLQIVSQETDGKSIVLILDAWEKSPTIERIYKTLSAFLSHLGEWPNCHIILGIRDPDLQINDLSSQSFRLVETLTDASPKAELVPLTPMNLTVSAEKQRILKHVREIAQGTQKLDDDDLIRLIDGFPGVIYRFREKSEQVEDVEELYKLAKEAQSYRYRELEILLPSLEGENLIMAIRLALFYRLDKSLWSQFREVLCEGLSPVVWERLRQKGILESASYPYPTYGHDTRYDDAFRRLEKSFPESVKGELENLVFRLVKRIKYIDDKDGHFVAALAGLRRKAQLLKLSNFHKTLCETAGILFMPELHHLALEDPDTVLATMLEVCPEAAYLICASLINRGVSKSRLGDNDGAIADFTIVVDMKNAPAKPVARALHNRGLVKGKLGNIKGEIADYTGVINVAGVSLEEVAKSLYNRGIAKKELGDRKGAIADYTLVINMEGAPLKQIVQALCNRGIAKKELGDRKGAIADFTIVVEMEDASAEEVAKAFNNRGIAKGRLGDKNGAITDFTTVIEMENAPLGGLTKALYNRGLVKGELGDSEGSINDYTSVVNMEGVPAVYVALALTNRGVMKERLGDREGAIADYTIADNIKRRIGGIK